MKSQVFLALALAAVVLGHRLNSLEPAAAESARSEAPRAAHRSVAPAADGLVRVSYESGPQAGLQAGPRSPSPAQEALTPGLPARASASTAMPASALPEQPTGPASRPLAATDAESPNWRDSALDLLSQIGVLCPAAGCDSLEDD